MADVTLGAKNNGLGFPRGLNNTSSDRMNTSATVIYVSGQVVKEAGIWQATQPNEIASVKINIYDISAGVDQAPLIYSTEIVSDPTNMDGDELYLVKSIANEALTGLTGGETLSLSVSWSSGVGAFRRVNGATSLSSNGADTADPANPFVETSTVNTETIDAYLILGDAAATTPTFRKGSQFTAETTLSGTVTAATLNGQAITVDSQVGTTVTLTDSDGSITTSGEYPLVLTDDSADPDETITVQVNVYGVAPANNPVQKDGAALASLTNVELRVSSGATLAGSQLYYSGTGTTDVSGNLGNIDLSSTAAADTDPVLLSIRTAAGDSIITAETVGLI